LGFQDDVKSLYAIADLAVLPTYYREGGYPRGLLEPMAMGKPVIATNSDHCRGAIEEGKNGLLVPVKDAEALAEAIRCIMSDDELRERMGRYSMLKAARDFDEEVIVPAALLKLGLPVANSLPSHAVLR
jgi:glycosyltransferase involved in cell wall biosynthesis